MEFTTSNSPSEEIYLDMTTNELACKITEDKVFVSITAMKCCDDVVLQRMLATLGSGFDTASMREIEQLLEIGINPSKILFANTVKFRTHIKFAASVGVHLMTFDSVEELLKIHECDSEARLIVRIQPLLESVAIPFGNRYGCSPREACHLVQKARDLNLVVEGISFHVGFICKNPKCYVETIKAARWVFDEVSKIGVKMSLLDIGGGYPGSRDSLNCFREIAAAIRETLDECFPPSSGIRVIAEPGQYMVAVAFNLYCKVILVKNKANSATLAEGEVCSSETDVHITDSKHGTFSCNVYHHQDIKILPLVHSSVNFGIANSQMGKSLKNKENVEVFPD
ncbi:ornithine decarboxylase-like [Tachypleus tridentatus]|uniref:ornithine decarboxylase-like n=1 Tax=Tachypleus tridentatus TaxID=6853 RepID=UPI003FD616A5